MALFDELDEQSNRHWRSRLARGRIDLSASVEATLADSTLVDDPLIDKPDESLPATKSIAMIAPRISLQSKSLDAVHAGPSLLRNSTEEPVVPGPNTNVFVRMAQRFTSSLASISTSLKPSELAPLPTSEHGSLSLVESKSTTEAMSLSKIEDAQKATTTTIEGLSALHPKEFPRPGQSKPRLAGHPTKVRLQAPSQPDGNLLQVAPALSSTTSSIKNQSEKISTFIASEILQTSLSQPDIIKGNIGTSRQISLSGSAAFENGQSEFSVSNQHITSSSVVVVMLSGDPGQTVLKYVSLQPQKGFTVHLSAPVKVKTPFNYVILMGELF